MESNSQITSACTGNQESKDELLNDELMTCVLAAAMDGNPNILKLRLQNGGDPFVSSKKLFTPLHFAVMNGSLQCVALLLEAVTSNEDLVQFQTYISSATEHGDTALMFAAQRGQLPICKLLSGSLVDSTNNAGCTALHLAAANGNYEVVKFLIDELQADFKILNGNGENPLYHAVVSGSDRHFSFLLDKMCHSHSSFIEIPENVISEKYNLNACLIRSEIVDSCCDYKGNSLLHAAVKHCNYRVIEKLIDLGVSKAATNVDGDTALHILSSISKTDHKFCAKKHSDICRIFLNSPMGLIHILNNNRETPLHLAARGGNVSVIKEIQLFNPNILSIDTNGMTAIHVAAENGEHNCIRKLMYGLDPPKFEELTKIIPTPLHLAALNGHLTCVKVILDEFKVSSSVKTISV